MSLNLNRKMLHLTLIEDWFESTVENRNLTQIFSDAIGASSVFLSIYISIRRNPQSAQEQATETYDYYNVGFTPLQIAEYFNTKFSLNYFGYCFRENDDYYKLRDRIRAIYTANKYKYMKLVEVLGYRYNPLFNVDGIELYSRAESVGDAVNTRTPSGTVTTVSGTKVNNAIGDSETIFYKNPYNDNSENTSVVDSKTKTNAITTEQSYSQGYNEKTDFENIPAYKFEYDEQEQKWKKSGVFSVDAKDNAFGEGFSGPERYYAEKRLRQGNIGVTKSTELLRDQREIVKFNILDEFFKDLEREIVVGIY